MWRHDWHLIRGGKCYVDERTGEGPGVPDPQVPEASSTASSPVGERVSQLSEQLREMAARLEAERAERIEVDRWRIQQLRGIVACQEDERERIARELREHLGQQLTALQLTVERLSADHPHASAGITQSLEMIADIGRGIDSIAWELRPAALDDLGLSAVLRSYLHQWSRHTRIRGTFHSGAVDGERFPREIEATLYRIARVALETVAHAGATSVEVLLERRDANALLVVEDDARTAPLLRDDESLGGMRERAAALGGTVEIEPAAAGGTTVLARLPLPSLYSGPRATEGGQVSTSACAAAEFVATVAHELRNPVAPMIFQIRLAIKKTEQMARAHEDVPHEWVQSQFRRVEQRMHRLLETLDRLLDVSRLSTGRLDLPRPPLEPRLVRDVD